MLILKLLFRRLMRTDQEQLRNVPLHLRTLQEKLKSFRYKTRFKTEVFRWARAIQARYGTSPILFMDEFSTVPM